MVPAAAQRPLVIGPLGPAQLACLVSWKRLGLRTALLQTEGPRQPWCIHRIADLHAHRPLQALKTPEGARWLAGWIVEQGITGLACVSDDLTIWLQENLRLPAQSAFWMNTPGVIRALESKAEQARVARHSGFELLPTWLVGSAAEVAKIPDSAFPLVLRPDGSRSVTPDFKVEIFRARQPLEAFVKARSRIVRPMVAQPFVRGPNLLVHGYRSADGVTERFVPFEVPRKHLGVAVELRSIAADPALQEACTRFSAWFGLKGVFHFDLLKDATTGRYYFLECNGRLGGTTGKVSAAGHDEALALLVAYGAVGPHVGVLMPPPAGRRAYNLQSAVKYLWSAARGRLLPLDYPDAGTLEALGALVGMVFGAEEEIGPSRNVWGGLAYHSQKFFRD